MGHIALKPIKPNPMKTANTPKNSKQHIALMSSALAETRSLRDNGHAFATRINPKRFPFRKTGKCAWGAAAALVLFATFQPAAAQVSYSTRGFKVGMHENGSFTLENTSSAGNNMVALEIRLANNTFFDTTNASPGLASTGWYVITNPSSMVINLPFDSATDGQQYAGMGFAGTFAPGTFVGIGFDLDNYANPDGPGFPTAAAFRAHFFNGQKVVSTLRNFAQPVGGTNYAYTTSVSAPVRGNSLLKVDFNTPTPSPTEPGWQAFNVSGSASAQTQSYAASATETSGNVSVTIKSSSGLLQSRDRLNPADGGFLTTGELMRDFAVTSNNNILELTIGGLTAGKQYVFTFHSHDHVTGFVQTWTNTTGGVQPSTSSQLFTGTEIFFDEQHTVSMSAVANGSGVVTFTATAGAGDSPRLNALEIHTIPEPGSIALLALGGMSLLSRRRCRLG